MSTLGMKLVLLTTALESYGLVVFAPRQLQWQPWSWTAALLATFFLNFVLQQAFYIFIWPNFISPLKHIPGPKGGAPWIGRGRALFERPPAQTFQKWYKQYKNDLGVIRFQGLYSDDTMLVTSPQAIAEILVQRSYMFEKPQQARDNLRQVLGDGLVVVEGDVHKFQRKKLLPSFGFRHIKDLYPIMWTKAQSLCKRIDQEFQGSHEVTLDMVSWAARATLDAIGLAALGRDFNSVFNDEDELAQLYRELTDPTPARIAYFAFSILVGVDLVKHLPLPITRRIKSQLLRLRQICRSFVNDKREAIEKRGEENHDILSVLLNYNEFSDDELVDQMLTFLAAGFDTTSLTFTWTCYVLATRPDIQKKLREEVLASMDELNAAHERNDGSLATLLEAMPYLNGVFHEVLRLYPTVPMTRRISNTETTILGQRYPKGSNFIFSSWMMNRLEEYWGPDSREFKPERWIDKETGKPNNHGGATNNYSFITFLCGPRSCIGGNFAKAELRCLLANWVANYDMEDANTKPVLPQGAVTLKPYYGMFLKARKLPTSAKA